MLAGAGVPIVEIMDTDGEAVDSVVGISHRRAGVEMARAIVAAGYRRIGFLGTNMPYDHRARKRMEGFEEGLVDFYTLRDDRLVFLCWRLGEPHVTYWHDIEDGFAGRQPVDDRILTETAP